MKSAPFEYFAPTSREETVGLLAKYGDAAKVLAGGQSLVPLMALRLARPSVLVDINHVGDLDGVDIDADGVTVGCLVRHVAVETNPQLRRACPLLPRAASYIGHFQIRNRGTVGGALAHSDAAAEWPAVALTLDAKIVIDGPDGPREVAAVEFFTGSFETTVEPTELIVSVRFPAWGSGSGWAVEEFAARPGDFAIAGVTAGVQVLDGKIARAAVGLLGLGPTPLRSQIVEAALAGSAPETLNFADIGRAGATVLDPPTDIHGSGNYRRQVAAELIRRAVERAITEATSG